MSFDPTQVLIETLREEIQFLRAQNKELTERVMSFSGTAHQAYLGRDLMAMKVPAPSYLDDLTGQIVSMDADSDEDKREKEEAIKLAEKMLSA